MRIRSEPRSVPKASPIGDHILERCSRCGRATPTISAAGWLQGWLSRCLMSQATRTRLETLYPLISRLTGCAVWLRSLNSRVLITMETTTPYYLAAQTQIGRAHV